MYTGGVLPRALKHRVSAKRAEVSHSQEDAKGSFAKLEPVFRSQQR